MVTEIFRSNRYLTVVLLLSAHKELGGQGVGPLATQG